MTGEGSSHGNLSLNSEKINIKLIYWDNVH